MGWGNNGVINRLALVHVGEIVFLQPKLAVFVQHKVDRLAVVFFDQLFKPDHGLGEGMVITKLGCAVQGDGLLRLGANCKHGREQRADQGLENFHWCLLGG